jgi:hypothetical protein
VFRAGCTPVVAARTHDSRLQVLHGSRLGSAAVAGIAQSDTCRTLEDLSTCHIPCCTC